MHKFLCFFNFSQIFQVLLQWGCRSPVSSFDADYMATRRGLLDFAGLVELNSRSFIKAFIICLWCFLMGGLSHASDQDVSCLRSIKESLRDPNNILESTWNFSNGTAGFICSFIGIECWHALDNKVFSISLPGMGLKGSFPLGIAGCSSLQGLDLSSNDLSGEIPSNISAIIPYVTTLDLSSNSFSGKIPVGLANCTYLNVLNLDHNRLSGQIPPQLGQLSRLKKFSVANNLLVGPVPHFGSFTVTADSFANNPGLCGYLLSPCQSASKKSNTGIVVGALVGGILVGAVVLGLAMFFARRVSIKKKEEDPEGNGWAKIIKGTKRIRVSMFEDSLSKMRFSDLMKATDNFSKQNIIGHGTMGTIY
uniref:Leucine-rich repeat-containing N-terminal plant-type domain-containing protein n=1 Tax=Opuntia streptacantha TaxID=393608 RepID=A0A7C9E865_OPUST